MVHEQKKNPFIVFIKTFINPFIGVLTGLAVISLVIDVLMAEPGEQEWTGVVIIAVMVVCSAILRFWQEWKANEATDSLMKMVKNTCLVKRAGSGEEELDITELVPGDIVFLAAGDMIPADLHHRIQGLVHQPGFPDRRVGTDREVSGSKGKAIPERQHRGTG